MCTYSQTIRISSTIHPHWSLPSQPCRMSTHTPISKITTSIWHLWILLISLLLELCTWSVSITRRINSCLTERTRSADALLAKDFNVMWSHRHAPTHSSLYLIVPSFYIPTLCIPVSYFNWISHHHSQYSGHSYSKIIWPRFPWLQWT